MHITNMSEGVTGRRNAPKRKRDCVQDEKTIGLEDQDVPLEIGGSAAAMELDEEDDVEDGLDSQREYFDEEDAAADPSLLEPPSPLSHALFNFKQAVAKNLVHMTVRAMTLARFHADRVFYQVSGVVLGYVSLVGIISARSNSPVDSETADFELDDSTGICVVRSMDLKAVRELALHNVYYCVVGEMAPLDTHSDWRHDDDDTRPFYLKSVSICRVRDPNQLTHHSLSVIVDHHSLENRGKVQKQRLVQLDHSAPKNDVKEKSASTRAPTPTTTPTLSRPTSRSQVDDKRRSTKIVLSAPIQKTSASSSSRTRGKLRSHHVPRSSGARGIIWNPRGGTTIAQKLPSDQEFLRRMTKQHKKA